MDKWQGGCLRGWVDACGRVGRSVVHCKAGLRSVPHLTVLPPAQSRHQENAPPSFLPPKHNKLMHVRVSAHVPPAAPASSRGQTCRSARRSPRRRDARCPPPTPTLVGQARCPARCRPALPPPHGLIKHVNTHTHTQPQQQQQQKRTNESACARCELHCGDSVCEGRKGGGGGF